ncbi:single-stranded DNA-binding protein [Sediminitomix flava]|uniref:Single-stranded DNA-binding protein n=1 Tax=Sediminitomix flava TaxID=379075 RepID=A0A315Z097_SEDFL|nr:single-stranded DNA-binding protein [Sediminitomix flava]PWJ36058.1 single-strand binding protein [Sediminitomix flava]
MAGINKVILIGNLGRDPEIRHFEGGSSVATFSIATSENWQDKSGEWKEETQWHNIVAWRWLAQRAEQYLKKGSRVYIEGKLTNRSYDKDGQTRYITEVVANNLMLLDPRPEAGGAPGGYSAPGAADMPNQMNQQPPSGTTNEPDAMNGGSEGEVDDLPF